MDGWMDGWMDGRMDGWMDDGWIDKPQNFIFLPLYRNWAFNTKRKEGILPTSVGVFETNPYSLYI